MFLPLDDQAKGQMDSLFEAIGRKCEKLDFALHSIAYAQSGSARQSYGLFARRLPQRHERVLLLIYPHGTARGSLSSYGEERAAVLHETSWGPSKLPSLEQRFLWMWQQPLARTRVKF